MHIYTLILNTYEFIDKIPEKLQGEKRAKTGKNRSKCVSFFVDGISETLRCGLFEQNGEKNQIEFISENPGRIISENPGQYLPQICKIFIHSFIHSHSKALHANIRI